MRVRTARELGLVIRERRRALGLDQASLARRVGASRQWVIAMEQGKRRAELTLVLRTLNALDLRLTVEPQSLSPDDLDLAALIEEARRPNGPTL